MTTMAALSDDEIRARVLRALQRSDDPADVADAMGPLLLCGSSPQATAKLMLDTWRTWRREHNQGPIPADWSISP